MFAFFVDGVFSGYWSNSVGDKFFDLTCAKKGWAKELTSLVFYPTMKAEEIQDSVPSMDDVKIGTLIPAEYSEEGELISPESLNVSKTIASDKFVVNGLMLIPC